MIIGYQCYRDYHESCPGGFAHGAVCECPCHEEGWGEELDVLGTEPDAER